MVLLSAKDMVSHYGMKCIILKYEIGECHNVSNDLIIDNDGLPLGNDYIAVQIAELLVEEDVPLE
jgi:hypothetical protein